MSLRELALGMTTSAVVKERDLVVRLVLVGPFFITAPEAVEPQAQVVSSVVVCSLLRRKVARESLLPDYRPAPLKPLIQHTL